MGSKKRDQIKDLKERLVRHAFFLRRGEGELLKLEDENFSRLIAENLPLNRATIVNCGFKFSNFSGSNFQDATLADTEFANCGLRRCDFRGSRMQGLRIARSDARQANLGFAKTSKLVLSKDSDPDQDLNAWSLVDLSDSDFAGADLSSASLAGAVMRGVNLTGVNLSRVDLRNADLTGACLAGANFTGTQLDGATLDDVVFGLDVETRKLFRDHPAYRKFMDDRASMIAMIDDHERWAASSGGKGRQACFKDQVVKGLDLSGRNLAGIDFSAATIIAAKFDKASLASANFRHATVRVASFAASDLRACDLTGSRFINCGFLGANFGTLAVEGYREPVASKWTQGHFIRCDFTGAKLPADLTEAMLENCTMPAPAAVVAEQGPRLPL